MSRKPPAAPAAPLKREARSRAAVFPRKIDPDTQLDLFEREALFTLQMSPRRGAARSR